MIAVQDFFVDEFDCDHTQGILYFEICEDLSYSYAVEGRSEIGCYKIRGVSFGEILEYLEIEYAAFIRDAVMVEGYEEPYHNVYVTQSGSVYDTTGTRLTSMDIDIERTDQWSRENGYEDFDSWEFETPIRVYWDGSNWCFQDLEEYV